ncbi:MAG: NAD(P)/FAD-dependent oxidoreductase [Clostridiales bacterium]|nr:NAD(P)/FAD-dependent oxidoreductase [Clostridiales bacterium]
MEKRIIVAGGGHGGIAAAAILARSGYDVTVFERNKRENMGYDWTDIFDKNGLTAAGMELPPKEKYAFKNNMTFFGPAMTVALRQNVPFDQLEIQMERRDIYNHIISHAENAGVKFVWETAVEAPVMIGNRVVGIQTKNGSEYADLVIDAAGINSTVRSKLPESLGIQNRVGAYEQFYVYRGFFNKLSEVTADKYRVFIFHDGKLGISWVVEEKNHIDVLIGRFSPFGIDEVNATLESLRKTNPCLGTELLRGGRFVSIPVRQPLGILVADGYAAIGDSAFMTVPVIGSGIANSLKAARMLADAVIADRSFSFSAQTLWKYQREFYKKLGAGLAPLACVKLMLTKLEPWELDYIFEHGILNGDDMTIGADAVSLGSFMKGIKFSDVRTKFSGVTGNKSVMKKVLSMGKQVAAATAVTAALPPQYEYNTAMRWVKSYNNCFK